MRTLLLGLRIALRGSRTRIAVTGLAMAFAVAFLLAVLGSMPARQAKLDRLVDRQTVDVGAEAAGGQRASGPALRMSSVYSWWRGHTLSGWEVVDVADGTPLPPGVDRLPRPGEVLASPALAKALRGPHGAELTPRVPGRVVGEIRPEGLSGPRELYAYVGVARSSSPYPAREIQRFGYRNERAAVPPELRVAAQLGAVGLLLPVLILVGTATRLSAGARDRRLAAVRLVGGTPAQVGLLVAAEALVMGVLGSALGMLVFWVLRPLAARIVPVEGGVFPADLQPPTGQLLAVVLVVPVLSLLVSLLAMRRLVVDPLGVRRRGRRRSRAGWWRVPPLALGLALLGMLWLRQGELAGPAVALLLAGGALTLIGLAVIAPVVSRAAGSLLVRLPGTASRLAGRRLLADPSATARTLTGTVLVVFVGTWLLAFLPIVEVSSGSDARELSKVLPTSTVSAGLGGPLPPQARTALGELPGVRQVVVVGTAQVARPGTSVTQGWAQVAVVRCPELATLLSRVLPCGTGGILRVQDAAGPELTGSLEVGGTDGQPLPGMRVVLPAGSPSVDLGLASWPLLQGEAIVDPSLLPSAATRAFVGRLFVTTDGDPATTERVRNALHAQGIFSAQTLDEQAREGARDLAGYERAARLGLVLAVLIGGVGLLIASIDAVRTRRRDLASLAALGVPVGVLRRALLLEVLAPLLGCTAVALGCGAFASAAYLAADTDKVGLPWGAWGGVAGLSLLIVLSLTWLTLPLARAAARPEHLRTE